jgi:hypothetical protein
VQKQATRKMVTIAVATLADTPTKKNVHQNVYLFLIDQGLAAARRESCGVHAWYARYFGVKNASHALPSNLISFQEPVIHDITGHGTRSHTMRAQQQRQLMESLQWTGASGYHNLIIKKQIDLDPSDSLKTPIARA